MSSSRHMNHVWKTKMSTQTGRILTVTHYNTLTFCDFILFIKVIKKLIAWLVLKAMQRKCNLANKLNIYFHFLRSFFFKISACPFSDHDSRLKCLVLYSNLINEISCRAMQVHCNYKDFVRFSWTTETCILFLLYECISFSFKWFCS